MNTRYFVLPFALLSFIGAGTAAAQDFDAMIRQQLQAGQALSMQMQQAEQQIVQQTMQNPDCQAKYQRHIASGGTLSYPQFAYQYAANRRLHAGRHRQLPPRRAGEPGGRTSHVERLPRRAGPARRRAGRVLGKLLRRPSRARPRDARPEHVGRSERRTGALAVVRRRQRLRRSEHRSGVRARRQRPVLRARPRRAVVSDDAVALIIFADFYLGGAPSFARASSSKACALSRRPASTMSAPS